MLEKVANWPEYPQNNGSDKENVAKKEEDCKLELSNKADEIFKCKTCDFITFFQRSLESHICIVKKKSTCPAPGCSNKFTSNESLKSHLLHDHNVRGDEVEFFLGSSFAEKPQQKIHIVDYQLLKKPNSTKLSPQKSKIFIKDVTLLRKPDLPHNDIAIPNIFDSLDLTTTEDDIFDDFLGPDEQIFDNEFDFDESANLNHVHCVPTPEPVSEVEIITPAAESDANANQAAKLPSGKIFVRKNLCSPDPTSDADGSTPANKIFVRSHESLTSHILTTGVVQQPPIAITPDCIIVTPDMAPAPPLDTFEQLIEGSELQASKIFVRSHESLTGAVETTDIKQQPPVSITPDCIIVPHSELAASMNNKFFIRNLGTLTNPLQGPANSQYFTAALDPVTTVDGDSSQVLATCVEQQPPVALTPDCIIVSSDQITNVASTGKIFIRNIETLTNPQQESEYFVTATNDAMSFTSDSMEDLSQKCKISIKNMNTLIEPNLMQPPAQQLIFGQAQNLVIQMTPHQSDESLLSYRDSSITPDTQPESSNVSTCGGNDDVIILDEDCETILAALDSGDMQNEIMELMETSHFGNAAVQSENVEYVQACDFESSGMQKEVDEIMETCRGGEMEIAHEVTIPFIHENVEVTEAPERIETPNEKTDIQKLEILGEDQQAVSSIVCKESEGQPMVRIPIDVDEKPPKKNLKIVKIEKKNLKLPPHLRDAKFLYKCSLKECGHHFSSKDLLMYHRKCHREGILVCPECPFKGCKTLESLHSHLWKLHKVDMDLYACQFCDYKTPNYKTMTYFHLKIHYDESNYKCDIDDCGQTFKTSKQLGNHKRCHNKAPMKEKENLSDAVKFRCGVCNKSYSTEVGLYTHSFEHKEGKKLNCDECDYSTNDHSAFRRHTSTHSQSTRYKCPACGYSSIQSNPYRRHIELHHPELAESLLFKCSDCKFVSISKDKYNGHLKKHDRGTIKSKKIKR